MDYNKVNQYLASLTIDDKNNEKAKVNDYIFSRKTEPEYKPEYTDNRLTNTNALPLPIDYNNGKSENDKKFTKKKREDNFNEKLNERHMLNFNNNRAPPPIMDQFYKNSRDY